MATTALVVQMDPPTNTQKNETDGWMGIGLCHFLSLSLFVCLDCVSDCVFDCFVQWSFVRSWLDEERRTKNEERRKEEEEEKAMIEAIFIGWILIVENKVIHY